MGSPRKPSKELELSGGFEKRPERKREHKLHGPKVPSVWIGDITVEKRRSNHRHLSNIHLSE
jgi:hypothetical protein